MYLLTVIVVTSGLPPSRVEFYNLPAAERLGVVVDLQRKVVWSIPAAIYPSPQS